MQSAEERPGCSAPPNMADSFQLQLPVSDSKDLQFSLCKSLLQIPPLQWRKIKQGTINSETFAYMSDFIMDLLQDLTQSIVTAVLPQLFTHMRTNSNSANVLLTKDDVSTYLGDSIQHALAMSFNKQTVAYSTYFFQLLTSIITRNINDILTLCSKTPLRDDVLPVFFVGSDCTLIELSEITKEAAAILKSAIAITQNDGPVQPPYDVFEKENYFILHALSENHAIDFLIASLTRLVNNFRISSHTPHHKCDSSTGFHRDLCLIVGSNSEILTVDWESNPERVPVHNDKSQPVEIWPFRTGNVPLQNNCKVINPVEMEAIEQTAKDLMDFIFLLTKEKSKDIFNTELDITVIREVTTTLTNQLFSIVMGRYSDQVPVIPPGQSLGKIVTYRSACANDPGVIAHCVYLKVEEMIYRTIMHVLQWTGWIGQSEGMVNQSDPFEPLNSIPDDLELVGKPGGGDQFPEEASEEDDDDDNDDIDLGEEEQQQLQRSVRSVLQMNLTRSIFMVLIVGEILTQAGMRDVWRTQRLLRKMITELHLNALLREPYDAFVMGRSYREICHEALQDLLNQYGSAPALRQAITQQDSSFDEALKEVIRNRLMMLDSDDLSLTVQNSEEEVVSSCWDRLVWSLRGVWNFCCLCTIFEPSMTSPDPSMTTL